MKYLPLFLIITLFLSLSACEAPSEAGNGNMVSQEGPSIDLMKSTVDAYNNGDFDAWASSFADTAKIYPQGYGLESVSVATDKENQMAFVQQSSDYKFETMVWEVVNMGGDTDWVHMWGTWTGTLKADGSEVTVPVFINPAIEQGKIVGMTRYLDASIFNDAIEAAAAAAEGTEAEE